MYTSNRWITALESRRLLTVTLEPDGTLHIVGTGLSDRVLTSYTENTLVVSINGVEQSFPRDKITSMFAELLGGSDLFDRRAFDLISQVPATVFGSAGNDTIVGSYGDDSLDGGAGNDSIIGNQGADTLAGGDGNDSLNGGDDPSNDFNPGFAADLLMGGKGDDTLAGDAGPDTFIGGDGEDAVSYADHNTTFLFPNLPIEGVVVTLDGVANDGSSVDAPGDSIAADVEDIQGTGGADTITGNDGPNRIDGGGGYDSVRGLGGDDWLRGGIVNGGAGDDTLSGAADYSDRTDNLSVTFDAGKILTINGTEHDTFKKGSAIILGSGSDKFVPNINGISDVYGGPGNDTLYGDNDGCDLFGQAGADRLFGGAGPDYINGGRGHDSMMPGSGGFDTVVYAGRTEPLRISLVDPFGNGAAGENDYIGPGFDGVDGGMANDLIIGNNRANSLRGQGGNDTLQGGGGSDTLLGGPDIDSLEGDAGDDDLVGDGTLLGGSGNDELRGSGTILGGPGDDTIFAEDTASIAGEAGDDQINIEQGENFIFDHPPSDTLSGGPGADTLRFDLFTNLKITLDGIANDMAPGKSSNVASDFETIIGGGGDDTIVGDGAANNLQGGDGDDSLVGSAGGDTLTGGLGNDTIVGGPGADLMFGNGGSDTFFAKDGVRDTLDGGSGSDTAQRDHSAMVSDQVHLIENLT